MKTFPRRMFPAVAVALSCAFGAFAGGTGVYIGSGYEIGAFTSGTGWNYDSSGRVNLTGEGRTYRFYGANTQGKVRIKCEVNCTVVLDGVELRGQDDGHGAIWLDTSKPNLEVTIEFMGTNAVYGGAFCAGIGVHEGQRLTLRGEKNAVLKAYGGENGAGIGGDSNNDGDAYTRCGTVEVYSGRVVAYAGAYAAGIGGGFAFDVPCLHNTCSRLAGGVRIYGGEVFAYGGVNSAGIGGGSCCQYSCMLEDGNTKKPYYYRFGAPGGSVEVHGGSVTASGGEDGAGIGGGCKAAGGSFTMTGGEVHADGGTYAAGIGNGAEVSGSDSFVYNISGGTVYARGGNHGAGIGGGDLSSGGCGYISGGRIYVVGSGPDSTGIGGGDPRSSSYDPTKLTITGGTIETRSLGVCAEPNHAADVIVTGGSIKIKSDLRGPDGCLSWNGSSVTDDFGHDLYEVRIGGFDPEEKVCLGDVLSLVGVNARVLKYGDNDMYADSDGVAHLLLPAAEHHIDSGLNLCTANVVPTRGKTAYDAVPGTIRITYDAVGGEFDGGSDVKLAARPVGSALGPLPTPVRSGYDFVCWRNANGAVVKSTDKPVRHQTFTAEWNRQSGSLLVTTSQDTGKTGSLRFAVNAANDDDTIELASGLDISLGSPLEIKGKRIHITRSDKSEQGACVIEGGAITVAADAALYLDGVNLGPFNSEEAPMISVAGRLYLSNCRVSSGFGASAIASRSGSLISLSRCTFIDCYSAGGGGAVDSCGILCATYCTFTRCQAGEEGGAISYHGTKSTDCCVLANCTFVGNSAAVSGGAAYLWLEAGAFHAVNCIFANNSADQVSGSDDLIRNHTDPVTPRLWYCALSAVPTGFQSVGGITGAAASPENLLVLDSSGWPERKLDAGSGVEHSYYELAPWSQAVNGGCVWCSGTSVVGYEIMRQPDGTQARQVLIDAGGSGTWTYPIIDQLRQLTCTEDANGDIVYRNAIGSVYRESKPVAKAVLEDNGRTLRFVYDREYYGSLGIGWFPVDRAVAQDPSAKPPWYDAARSTVTAVEFDWTFAYYAPEGFHCGCWFKDFTRLTGVYGQACLQSFRVTSMREMFSGCTALASLDVSDWDTTALQPDVTGMFNGCTALTKIYASERFLVKNGPCNIDPFHGCTKLAGGKSTRCVSGAESAMYACIDGGAAAPGYFTANAVESSDYRVRFFAGGGSGSMSDMLCRPGSVYTLKENAFSSSGGFRYWRSLGGQVYDDGMLVFDLAKPGETVNLIAVWEK